MFDDPPKAGRATTQVSWVGLGWVGCTQGKHKCRKSTLRSYNNVRSSTSMNSIVVLE